MEGAIARRSTQGVEIRTDRQGLLKRTTVRLEPGLAVVFEEFRGGRNHVFSHRAPQVLDAGTQLSYSCEFLEGTCIPNGRSIGTLHLGTERLVARAQREAVLLSA